MIFQSVLMLLIKLTSNIIKYPMPKNIYKIMFGFFKKNVYWIIKRLHKCEVFNSMNY